MVKFTTVKLKSMITVISILVMMKKVMSEYIFRHLKLIVAKVSLEI